MRLDSGFDLLNEKLRLSLATAPDHLSRVNLHTLTELQRALVVVDGTVSTFIEAYTLEPVDAIRLGGGPELSFCDRFWLDVPQGKEVSVRRVVLQGEFSRSFYVYSLSHIVPDRLPTEARDRLEAGDEDLDEILDDVGLESRRELLWIGREELKRVPVPLAIQGHSEFISRAYRVIAAGRPIALVNERFPVTLGAQASLH